MGYYTEYYLTVRKVKSEENFNELTEELVKRDLIHYAFDDGHYSEKDKEAVYYPFESAKWYRHSEEMVMISEKFPKMTFELEGVGESFGDFWKEYYHDGQVEVCRGEVVYEQPKKTQWNQLIVF